MSQVLIERGRSSARRGSKLVRSEDPVQTRQSTSRRWKNPREDSYHRVPVLRRFLASRCGLPWDAVYAEIRSNIRATSQKLWMVLQMLPVERNVVTVDEDGTPRDATGLSCGDDFWVHPDTGILHEPVPFRSRRALHRRTRFAQLDIDGLHKYVRIEGIWYFVTFAEFSYYRRGKRVEDIILKVRPRNHYRPDELIREWGKAIYAVSKRQIGKQEIRRFIKGRAA